MATVRRCLKCEKVLRFDDEVGCLYGAGYIELSFHYGSRYDQCHGYHRRKEKIVREGSDDTRTRLLASEKIEGFLCDECFASHLDLFRPLDCS